MKKSTKGALAAGAAASLLLGGAGSLAYWTSTGTIDGTSISSGHLKLVSPSCDGWKLDNETTAFDPAADQIVPGDVLTQVCHYTVDAKGKHILAIDVNHSVNAGTAQRQQAHHGAQCDALAGAGFTENA